MTPLRQLDSTLRSVECSPVGDEGMKDYEFKLLVIHNLRNYVTNDKSKDGWATRCSH